VLTDECETIVVHTQQSNRGVMLPSGAGGVDLSALLEHLGDKGIQELLVEGGPVVWSQFIQEGLVDRAIIIRSPITLGEGPMSGITDSKLSDGGLDLVKQTKWEDDEVQFWSRPELTWPADLWP
tara:strand:+ start:100 stop:471 length:372 start_codon:yes stop_codon:yes gene_type:complete